MARQELGCNHLWLGQCQVLPWQDQRAGAQALSLELHDVADRASALLVPWPNGQVPLAPAGLKV